MSVEKFGEKVYPSSAVRHGSAVVISDEEIRDSFDPKEIQLMVRKKLIMGMLDLQKDEIAKGNIVIDVSVRRESGTFFGSGMRLSIEVVTCHPEVWAEFLYQYDLL